MRSLSVEQRAASAALLLLAAYVTPAAASAHHAVSLRLQAAATCSPWSVPQPERCEYVRQHCSALAGNLFDFLDIHFCGLSDRPWASLLLQALYLAFMFIVMLEACDRFFCPAIERISEWLKLSPTVAGATLLAFGNGATDLFTQIAMALSGKPRNESFELALTEPLGTGMFVTHLVVAFIILVTPMRRVAVSPYSFMKDCLFFLGGVGGLLVVLLRGSIERWQAVLPALYYVMYIVVTVLMGRGMQPLHADPRRHEIPHYRTTSHMDDIWVQKAEAELKAEKAAAVLRARARKAKSLVPAAAPVAEDWQPGLTGEGKVAEQVQLLSGGQHFSYGQPVPATSLPTIAEKLPSGAVSSEEQPLAADGVPLARGHSFVGTSNPDEGRDQGFSPALQDASIPPTSAPCSPLGPGWHFWKVLPWRRGRGTGNIAAAGLVEPGSEGKHRGALGLREPLLEQQQRQCEEGGGPPERERVLLAVQADSTTQYPTNSTGVSPATGAAPALVSPPLSPQEGGYGARPRFADMRQVVVKGSEDSVGNKWGDGSSEGAGAEEKSGESDEDVGRRINWWHLVRSPVTQAMSVTLPRISNREGSAARYRKPYAVLLPFVLPALLATYLFGWNPYMADWHSDARLWQAAAACIAASLIVLLVYPSCGTLRGPWLVVCTVIAFLGSMLYMQFAATEIVAVTMAAGTIFEISSPVLAATLLSWAGAAGDAIANLSLARDGFPTMALTACFSSPLFVLLGGLTCTLFIFAWEGQGPIILPHPDELVVLYSSCVVCCTVWVLSMPLVFKYQLTSKTAAMAMGMYAVFQLVYIYYAAK